MEEVFKNCTFAYCLTGHNLVEACVDRDGETYTEHFDMYHTHNAHITFRSLPTSTNA